MNPLSLGGREYAFMTAWISLFFLWRFIDLPLLLGENIARILG